MDMSSGNDCDPLLLKMVSVPIVLMVILHSYVSLPKVTYYVYVELPPKILCAMNKSDRTLNGV